MIRALSNASTGILFGQLWQGNDVGVRKELDRLFGRGKQKLGVVEEFGGEDIQEEEKKCLAMIFVSVHGTNLIALMNFGAIPNVLSSTVAKRLALNLEQSIKMVTVADGSKSLVKGKLARVPVLLESLEAEIYFVVIHNIPFDLVIGRPRLKRIGGMLDFLTEVARLYCQCRQATLPLVSVYNRPKGTSGSTYSEDFT